MDFHLSNFISNSCISALVIPLILSIVGLLLRFSNKLLYSICFSNG